MLAALTTKQTAADKAWKKDRDAAERVLLRYGKSLLTAIPEMVVFWIYSSIPETSDEEGEDGDGDGDGDGDNVQEQRLAFAFADTLNKAVHGHTDPTTHMTVVYPVLGVAVATEVLRVAATMPDTCETVQQRLQYLLDNCSLDSRAEASGLGGEDVTIPQVAVPFAFGATKPMSVADVAVVQDHLASGDVTTAAKLVACFSSKPAVDLTVVASPAGASMMPVEQLRTSLHRMAKMAPVVLFRALTGMHCIGPGVFEKSKAPTVARPAGLCSLHNESLLLHYARHLETVFEHAT